MESIMCVCVSVCESKDLRYLLTHVSVEIFIDFDRLPLSSKGPSNSRQRAQNIFLNFFQNKKY